MSNSAWKQAVEAEPAPCPQPNCPGRLAGFYHVTMAAPYPFEQIGFTKSSIKSKSVGIVATAWDAASVYCPTCGWRPEDRREAAKSEIITRLMRALILRGVKPSEVQRIVGSGVSVIDVLAATHPDPHGSGRLPPV